VASGVAVRVIGLHRHPPKSNAALVATAAGLGHPSLAAKRIEPDDPDQIAARLRSRTLSNFKPGRVWRAWHGMHEPVGLTTMKRLPQPSMQLFG